MKKRTAVAALAGILSLSMLAGCGEKEIAFDGNNTVATVNGTEIPLGLVSLTARQQQAEIYNMYLSISGYAYSIWDQIADAETGETFGEQAVADVMEQVELRYIIREKAAEYGVEVTEEELETIAAAAAEFMADNTEETLAELGVTEEQVKTYLELETYAKKMYGNIIADVDTEISDEEAQQSAFSYVSVPTASEELTEEELETKKAQAEELLEAMLADPAADMQEAADAIDESLMALSGTYTTHPTEETTDSYPEEVMTVLRDLEEGEVGPELIEAEGNLYVVKLEAMFDEDATESMKENILYEREGDLYEEVTTAWLEEADIEVDEEILGSLKMTDRHTFVMKAEEEVTEEATDGEGQEATDGEGEEATEGEGTLEEVEEDSLEVTAEEVTEELLAEEETAEEQNTEE